MSKYDIRQISAMLADRVQSVCEWLLPSGKAISGEWCCGNVHGDPGDSLRVNMRGKPGLWRDFASDDKGGDLIDLLMAVLGVSKADAVKEARLFLGLSDDATNFTPKRREWAKPDKPECHKPQHGVAAFMTGRGLSPETVAAFKIGEQGNVIVFPYLRDGELIHVKYRDSADKKKMWSSKESEPCLFGWQTIPDGCRRVAITEGELDAMSLWQCGIPALSVPNGGGDGDKQDRWIDTEWDRLQLFDDIILALDNDAQGKTAAEHIAARLGLHRCLWVDFGQHKDANEALQAGADLVALVAAAKSISPPELRSASDFTGQVADFFEHGPETTGKSMPWGKVDQLMRTRPGEVSIWAGVNGHGKSQVAGHVMVNSIFQGERWCAASMEFRPVRLLARLYRQASGISQPDPQQCWEILRPFFDGNLYIFDVQGNAKGERILEVFQYAYRRFGCRQFLVDSLAKCGFGEDDYNGQKAFVDSLAEFALHNDVHVHLVCHSRKGTKESEMLDKFSVKGTGAITDMVDNVFLVWRNKVKEKKLQDAKDEGTKKRLREENPDCVLSCCKQRNGDWEGQVRLWFDPASLQYVEGWGVQPKRYAR